MRKAEVLFCIGYQGKSIDGLCETLAENDVKVLVDVRERAWSHRPEFRKTALAAALAGHGIGYEHYKAAGNPFRPRKGEAPSRAACMDQYGQYLAESPAVVDGLRRMALKQRVALFCYEHESSECHRALLVTAIVDSDKARRQIVHL